MGDVIKKVWTVIELRTDFGKFVSNFYKYYLMSKICINSYYETHTCKFGYMIPIFYNDKVTIQTCNGSIISIHIDMIIFSI